MTRLRDRGGASPETLHELTNGYVGPSKSPKQRPGTTWRFALPANTKGLCAYKNKLYVFSATPIAAGLTLPTPVNATHGTTTTGGSLVAGTYWYRVSAINDQGETLASTETSMVVPAGTATNTVVVNWTAVVTPAGVSPVTRYKIYGRTTGVEQLMQTVGLVTTWTDDGTVAPVGPLPATNTTSSYVISTLRHPSSTFTGKLLDIHYAQSFLGYLYVVAEFDDGQIFHYWLQVKSNWLASHAYQPNETVQPTTPNGYYYQATSGLNPLAWAPAVKRAVNDVVQPTKTTGWIYTCTAVTGNNPVSGATEPVWPQVNGATVIEFVEAAPVTPPIPPVTPAPNPGDYGNPGGAGGGGGSGGWHNPPPRFR